MSYKNLSRMSTKELNAIANNYDHELHDYAQEELENRNSSGNNKGFDRRSRQMARNNKFYQDME